MRIKKTMPYISAFSAELSADEIVFLAKHNDINYISSNRPVSSCLDIARPAIGADSLQEAGISGRNVGVAVIDSGMYPHPDVSGAIDASVDFTDEDSGATDSLGHGTHGNRVGEYYFSLSGTSMAAPMVAGLAALILQRRPDFSPDDTKSVLTSTAEDKGLEANRQGMGYVNGMLVLRYLPNLQTSWHGNNLTVLFS
ncbi:MAG: S8 family serine peptidase [Bacillota bacterium]|nr:S8 family serine peptidase [Bacillota bacterium]